MPDSTATTEVPAYPLPQGHSFGPRGGSIMWNDGRDEMYARLALAQWQRRYRENVNRGWKGDPSGVYDGHTQKAAVDVQKKLGLPVDGLIGPDTWAAVWAYAPPKRQQPPPVEKVRGRVRALNGHSRKSWHYWRKFSNWKIQYAQDPDLPPWWPGRPFGPHERGWHVREIQTLLSVPETGTYNKETVRRVRGVQRLHEIPVSGVVDARTALLIDPGPWPEKTEDE